VSDAAPLVVAPASTQRGRFVASLGFELDDFQRRALDALDAGRSVLVAAPTGAGKTVVGEYAVDRAVAAGAKAFYTTPLKALSNQKYGDLVRRYGPDRVGLLTGDNVINPDAPVIVMTTEVLRNMIYARSPALVGLRYVILDEVHYLENAWRGPVWEEVIIHTPPEVDLVCLSATVSNAEEFADWLQTVRGAAEAIIEERRPVELTHLYLLADRRSGEQMLLPTFVDGRPNPEASALDSESSRGPGARRRTRPRFAVPRRAEVVELLAGRDMLPGIYFIFSRAACDDAVRACRAAGVRLTTAAERRQIRAIAEARVESLSDSDLRVLGYGEWLDGLEAGIASHHAGLVPPFKEAVEACFAAGLAKVVFATETLSLGINMPARSVVIEKLTKFTGEHHEFLRPGEYTQLTGRAGRRGIDTQGYAVVLWSPFVPFDQVAGLASTRTYALTSAFRPTYNMAANLVRRYAPDQAHHLLNLSFAQYRADGDVVRLETELQRAQEQVAALRLRATCELGDIEEYRRLLAGAQRIGHSRPRDRGAIEEGLRRIRPGDVLVVPPVGRVAVVTTSTRSGGELRLAVAATDGSRHVLTSRDLLAPPEPIGHLGLPEPYRPHAKSYLREVAARLRDTRLRPDPVAGAGPAEGASASAEAASDHPVATCPDRRGHLRAAERADRLEGDARRLEHAIRSRTESLARQFDRVLRVLEAWGYVSGWALTPAGERLARLYHECDLLVAEALGRGLLDDLDPPSVAALVSVFTYESRGPGGVEAVRSLPSRRVGERWLAIEQLATSLGRVEADAGLPVTRAPDPGFAALAHGWASGRELGQLIAEEEMSGGDFVRNIKQLLDLLRQLAELAPSPGTRSACGAAAERVFRGVVAASSVVTAGGPG